MPYPNDSPYRLVLCTCPDEETANKLAALLVEQRQAACVNIVPSVTSVYRWKDKIETEREHLLIIKTRANCYGAVEKLIEKHHPYELPEVIAVTIGDGLAGYLHWLDQELQGRS